MNQGGTADLNSPLTNLLVLSGAFFIKVLYRGDEYMSEGRFGIYGGQYIPETLMDAVQELADSYEKLRSNPSFIKLDSSKFSKLKLHQR